MKQLGIVDSAFVNLEHPNVPQHVGGLGLYDPSTAEGGFVRFKQVLANFEERLKKVPMFRTRLVEVPLGLDRPYFVVDKNFDVEFHIRHIALPRPGDWRQLCIQVARLHARPLDMRRPLWEVYVIEGLDNVEGVAPGGFAVYTKMHHCLIDGAGGQDFMTVLHDFEPDPGPAKPEEIEPFSEAQPSELGLAWRALGNHLGGAAGTARDTLGLFTDVLKTAYRIRSGDLPGYTSGGPKTRFDRPIGPHRVFDALSFRLEDIRAIKDKSQATVNDVVVAIVSGAIRKYLLQKDELPAEPLALSMPVNMRTRKGESGDANQIGSIMSLIHTDVEDPLERLAKIRSSIGEAKKFIDTPLVDVQKLAGVFSPLIAKPTAGLYVGQGLTRLLPTGNCGIVTNIVGAPVQLYCAGARLTHYHCLGLLTPGCGLCHAAFSMNEELSLAFLANRDVMPDPAFYRDCLENSFRALSQASRKRGGSKKRRSKRPAATPTSRKGDKKKTA